MVGKKKIDLKTPTFSAFVYVKRAFVRPEYCDFF